MGRDQPGRKMAPDFKKAEARCTTPIPSAWRNGCNSGGPAIFWPCADETSSQAQQQKAVGSRTRPSYGQERRRLSRCDQEQLEDALPLTVQCCRASCAERPPPEDKRESEPMRCSREQRCSREHRMLDALDSEEQLRREEHLRREELRREPPGGKLSGAQADLGYGRADLPADAQRSNGSGVQQSGEHRKEYHLQLTEIIPTSGGPPLLEDPLDDELRLRLSRLDGKLDQLTSQVRRCVDAIAALEPQLVASRWNSGCSKNFENEEFHAQAHVPRDLMCEDEEQESSLSYKIESIRMPSKDVTRPTSARTQRSARSAYSAGEFIRHHRSEIAERIWFFLDDPESSRAAYLFSQMWLLFILSSVAFTLMQTAEPAPFSAMTGAIVETSFDIVFIIELLTRFAVCSSSCGFVKSPYNIIDMVALLPLLVRCALGFVIPHDEAKPVRFIFFGCVPVLRLLKLLRQLQLFHLFMRVMSMTWEALKFLLFMLLIIVLTFSSFMYLVEPVSNIDSLPTAMWFTIVTMTTVGYGEITPDTGFGHGIAVTLIISSVLYMALPVGILGNAFTHVWQERDHILLASRTHDRLIEWGYTANDIPMVFRHFDNHKKGELNFHEFRSMLKELHIVIEEYRAVELFESLDKDGGGSVDHKEFLRCLFPSTYHELYGKKPTLPKAKKKPFLSRTNSGTRHAPATT